MTLKRQLNEEQKQWLSTVIRDHWIELVKYVEHRLPPNLKMWADDMVQDAIVKTIEIFIGQRTGGIDLERDPVPWLARVIYRNALDLMKLAHLRPPNTTHLGLDPAALEAPVPTDNSTGIADSELLEALDTIWTSNVLTVTEREILIASAKGRTAEEIGETLGVTAGTVRVRIFRAKRKVKTALKSMDFEVEPDGDEPNREPTRASPVTEGTRTSPSIDPDKDDDSIAAPTIERKEANK